MILRCPVAYSRLQGVVAVVNRVSMKGRNGFGITSLLSDVLRDGPMHLTKEVRASDFL